MAVEHRIIYLADKLLRHPHKRYAQRKHGDIARIVIHHSGRPGIGYHFVIGKEGEVWKVNDLTTVSFHAIGANSDGVGICLVGNFSVEKPAPAQLASLRWLIGRLQAELQPVPYVVLHRDIKGSKTSCPGLRFTRAMLRG
jgi:N-acetyl-anhydromuramyl-L-alanine amidase AmpD